MIEEGDHRSLMEKKGKYFDLFSTQAKRYVDASPENENGGGEEMPHMAPRFGKRPPMPPHAEGERMPPQNGDPDQNN